LLKSILFAIFLTIGLTFSASRADDMFDINYDDSGTTDCYKKSGRWQIIRGICKKIVFNETPSTNPGAFNKVRRSTALEHKKDGSIWEPDRTQHGGEQYKRWDNEKDWGSGKKPSSVWPDGSVRK